MQCVSFRHAYVLLQNTCYAPRAYFYLRSAESDPNSFFMNNIRVRTTMICRQCQAWLNKCTHLKGKCLLCYELIHTSPPPSLPSARANKAEQSSWSTSSLGAQHDGRQYCVPTCPGSRPTTARAAGMDPYDRSRQRHFRGAGAVRHRRWGIHS